MTITLSSDSAQRLKAQAAESGLHQSDSGLARKQARFLLHLHCWQMPNLLLYGFCIVLMPSLDILPICPCFHRMLAILTNICMYCIACVLILSVCITCICNCMLWTCSVDMYSSFWCTMTNAGYAKTSLHGHILYPCKGYNVQ